MDSQSRCKPRAVQFSTEVGRSTQFDRFLVFGTETYTWFWFLLQSVFSNNRGITSHTEKTGISVALAYWCSFCSRALTYSPKAQLPCRMADIFGHVKLVMGSDIVYPYLKLLFSVGLVWTLHFSIIQIYRWSSVVTSLLSFRACLEAMYNILNLKQWSAQLIEVTMKVQNGES